MEIRQLLLNNSVDLPMFPLFQGSDRYVYEPSLEYFVSKIQNGNSFSLVRQQSEWWDVVYGGLLTLQQDTVVDFTDSAFLDLLVEAMRFNYHKIGASRGWTPHTFEVWRESLEIITSPKPDNFYSCVSQGASHNFDILKDSDVPLPVDFTQAPHFLTGRPTPPQVEDLISSLFPKSEKLWRSTVWRKWGASGEIHDFFETFKEDAIVLVGRSVYSNFGDKLKLPNFHFIPIHPTEASQNITATTSLMKELHNHIISLGHRRIIYMMMGGDTTRCMQWRLHGKLEGEVFMIDVGRGLDPYYREDSVFENNSAMWGHWHNSYKSWVKERCPYVVR